jgi:transposase
MDIGEKDKKIIFLRDMVEQLRMQVSILQKRIKKKQKNPRYILRERLFILWQMETYQIPRRRVTEYFGIARSTLYRWLHKIEDQQQPSSPANKTPMEIIQTHFSTQNLSCSYTLSESVYAGRNLEVSGWVGYHAAREAQSRCIGIAE